MALVITSPKIIWLIMILGGRLFCIIEFGVLGLECLINIVICYVLLPSSSFFVWSYLPPSCVKHGCCDATLRKIFNRRLAERIRTRKKPVEIKNNSNIAAAYLQAALFLYQISDGQRLFIEYESCSLGFLHIVFDGLFRGSAEEKRKVPAAH